MMSTNQSTASNSGNTATNSQPAGGGNSIATQQPDNKLATYQHWAETAVIGNDTRRLLIIWGKMTDAANEYSELIEKLYGVQVYQILEPFWANFSKASDEVLSMIPAFIIEGREVSRKERAEI